MRSVSQEPVQVAVLDHLRVDELGQLAVLQPALGLQRAAFRQVAFRAAREAAA